MHSSKIFRYNLYKNIGKVVDDIKRKYIVLYTVIFLIFVGLLVNYGIQSMDEVWCFSFSKRIAEGYIPYKDYNIIVTPLFFFIGSLFSRSLMLFRIYGALISSAIVFLTFYICKKNNVDMQLTIIITFINCILILLIPFANYNIMLILGLMILYLIANRFFEKKDKQSSFLFGFSLSIVILIKQSAPAALIILFTCIIFLQLLSGVIKFKIFIYYALGGITPAIFFIFYAIINNSLGAFINYTILGMHSFSENYMVQDGTQLLILCSIMITILLAVRVFKSKHDKLVNMTTLIFSLSTYILIYPLVDKYYSILLLIFNITLSSILFKNISIKLNFVKSAVIVSLIILCTIEAFMPIEATKEGFTRSKIQPYTNILMSENTEKNISAVSFFIKEQEMKGCDVAIIDGSAYLYNIPAHDYNGVLDMICKGNMGQFSNDEVISLINEKDIILTNEIYRWHDIQEIREYVFNNYIGDMKVYRKP